MGSVNLYFALLGVSLQGINFYMVFVIIVI